jgi:hypothetical protein
MRVTKVHLGTGFEVWTFRQTWFWRLYDPCRNGGTIGAAATEAQADREARMSIEELASTPASGDLGLTAMGAPGWERSLASLERYLIRENSAAA